MFNVLYAQVPVDAACRCRASSSFSRGLGSVRSATFCLKTRWRVRRVRVCWHLVSLSLLSTPCAVVHVLGSARVDATRARVRRRVLDCVRRKSCRSARRSLLADRHSLAHHVHVVARAGSAHAVRQLFFHGRLDPTRSRVRRQGRTGSARAGATSRARQTYHHQLDALRDVSCRTSWLGSCGVTLNV